MNALKKALWSVDRHLEGDRAPLRPRGRFTVFVGLGAMAERKRPDHYGHPWR